MNICIHVGPTTNGAFTGLDGEDDRLLRRLQGQPSARVDDVLQPAAGLYPHRALLFPPQSRPRHQAVSSVQAPFLDVSFKIPTFNR